MAAGQQEKEEKDDANVGKRCCWVVACGAWGEANIALEKQKKVGRLARK
jgi:hypothetical protein